MTQFSQTPELPFRKKSSNVLVAILSQLGSHSSPSFRSFPGHIFNLFSSSSFSRAGGLWLTQFCLSTSCCQSQGICSLSFIFTWKWLFSVQVLSPKRSRRAFARDAVFLWLPSDEWLALAPSVSLLVVLPHAAQNNVLCTSVLVHFRSHFGTILVS